LTCRTAAVLEEGRDSSSLSRTTKAEGRDQPAVAVGFMGARLN